MSAPPPRTSSSRQSDNSVIPGRVENANPESRRNDFWIPDRSEGGASGMTEDLIGGSMSRLFHALKYPISVVVASSRAFGAQ